MTGLIVSRKLYEGIVINGNVRVSIQEIDRGKVRLRIEADRSIPVCRDEIEDREVLSRFHVFNPYPSR